MRNVDDNRAAEGPQPDGGNGVYTSVVARRSRRRRHLMIGAAGLAVVLGAGAVVTHQARDNATAVAEPQVMAPIASDPPVGKPAADPSSAPSSPAAPVPLVALAAPPQGAARTTAPVDPVTPRPKTTSERIKAAREAGAKGGVPVQRPLPEKATAAAAAADVTEVNVPTASGMLKVVSAPSDLTGVRELAWVVDEGVPVGRARCTNKIRLSPDVPAKTRPTLLLCWVTGATKSAYTIAADPAGPPSAKESVAAIDKALAKL